MNEVKKITKEVTRAFEKICVLRARIRELQEKCNHPNVVKIYKGDTGNYDPTIDCWWTEYDCPDCQKHWSGNYKFRY